MEVGEAGIGQAEAAKLLQRGATRETTLQFGGIPSSSMASQITALGPANKTTTTTVTETTDLTIHQPTTGGTATMMPQAATREVISLITPAIVPISLHRPSVVTDGAVVAGETARPKVLAATPTPEVVVAGTILLASRAH